MARILMLCSNFPPMQGGISRYCYELAVAASASGNEVVVVAPLPGDKAFDQGLPFEVRRYRVRSRPRIPWARKLGIAALIDTLVHLLEIRSSLAEVTFDVLHATHFRDVEALTLLGYFKRTVFLATVYGTEVLEISAGKRKTRVLRPFARADRIVAISDYTRRLLLDKFGGVDESRVEVVPLGVGDQWFEPASSGSSVRGRWDLSDDSRIVLSVGRLEERKGNHVLIEALSRLPDELQEGLVYIAVGEEAPWETGYRESLERLAASAVFRTIFAGAISDTEIRDLYSVAEIFCLPGSPHPERVEGFGLVLLEAAAQATVSITTDVGGVPEVVIDGVTGLVVPAGNSVALAESIRRLLEDPNAAIALGEAAQSHARKMSWDLCSRRTYQIT